MQLIPIEQLENNLSFRSKPVDIDTVDPNDLYVYLLELTEFLQDNNGAGIAACQIGDFRKIAVVPIRGKNTLIINPSYRKNGSRKKYLERCLSYPGREFIMKRYKSIHVDFWTITQDACDMVQIKRLTISGKEAVCFQHETDHCTGIHCGVKGDEIV